jgi:hypothetical protein
MSTPATVLPPQVAAPRVNSPYLILLDHLRQPLDACDHRMPPVRSRFLFGCVGYDVHVYGRVYVLTSTPHAPNHAQNALTPVWSEANRIAIAYGTPWDITSSQIYMEKNQGVLTPEGIGGTPSSSPLSRGCGRRWRRRRWRHGGLRRWGQWRFRRRGKRGLCPGPPQAFTAARVCCLTTRHQISLSLRCEANGSVRASPPLHTREVRRSRCLGCRMCGFPHSDAGVLSRPAGSAR